MPIETITHLSDLNKVNPLPGDRKKEGDDHIRNIKTALLNTFVGFPGVLICAGVEVQGATVNDYTMTVSPAVEAYEENLICIFQATHTNTGGCTFKLGALAAIGIVTTDGAALSADDIINGALCVGVYRSPNLVLVSALEKANRHGEVYDGVHNFLAGTVQVVTQAFGYSGNEPINGAALQPELAVKAPIASPTFTGVPRAPTASTGSSGTQLATLDFVNATTGSAALPGQAGKNRAHLTSDGTDATFKFYRAKLFFLSQS